MTAKVDAEHFEALYQGSEDPWAFASSRYELGRYRILLQGLRRSCYPTAFEIGCSIGVFTAMLASRCERLLAIDVAPAAIALAQKRCINLPQVELRVADVRATAQEGPFDLILLNEVGYYFEVEGLAALARQLSTMLSKHGEFVASHWLGHSADHVCHGDEVHRVLERTLPLRHIIATRFRHFRVDAWTQTSAAP